MRKLTEEEFKKIAEDTKRAVREVAKETEIMSAELNKRAVFHAIKKVHGVEPEEYYRNGGTYKREKYWNGPEQRNPSEYEKPNRDLEYFLAGSFTIFLLLKIIFEELVY